MSENIRQNVKKIETKRGNLIFRKPKKKFSQTKNKNLPVEQVLHLQQIIGNRAVTRLIQSGAIQAELTVGKHNDIYEKEVDNVAGRMMSMKDSLSVQRQEPEEEVMPRLMDNHRLQREALPEEEEEAAQPRLQRQPEAEEEEESAVGRVREKLTVGSPGDVYEQEADRVAEAISSRGGISDLSNMTPIQQKLLSSVDPRTLGTINEKNIWPIVSKDTVGSKRLTVNRKKESPQQNSGSVSANIENRILRSKGKGNQLPQPMQNYMAIQAGYDFSNVRIKADSEAAELNTALGARAFANGADIWLGRGEKVTDVKLMAHELTHVVQQGGAKRLQTQSDSLSRTLASKDFMPKFMQTLTTHPQGNSALFQKGILQFAKENPPGRMTALQARILDGSRSGMPNLRESAQTLRGCIPSCNPSSSSGPSSSAPSNPTFSSTAFNKGTGGALTVSLGATQAGIKSSAYSPSGKVKASGGNNAGAKDWEAGFIQTITHSKIQAHYKGSKKEKTRTESVPVPKRDALVQSGAPWYDPNNTNGPGKVAFTTTNSTLSVSLWDKPRTYPPWTTPDGKGKLDRNDGKDSFTSWMIARKKSSPNTIVYLNWTSWEVDYGVTFNYASANQKTVKAKTGSTKNTGSGAGKGSVNPVLSGTIANSAISVNWT